MEEGKEEAYASKIDVRCRLEIFFDQGLLQLTVHNGYMRTCSYILGHLLFLTLVQKGTFFVKLGRLSFQVDGSFFFFKET